MTFLGLLNWIVAFFVRAACGLLLTALVPVLLVGLAFHWFDVGGADWAAKWIVTVFGPFFVAFVFIFWKVWHLARTGRHIGMWATLLVFFGTYLWHWMNWLQRVEVIVLALMLVHIGVVVIHVSYCYRLACRAEVIDTASSAFQRGRRKLVADLSIKVGTLKSIALVAPYLGLSGTCSDIVTGFRGIDIVADSALAAVMASGTVIVAFITTIAGLLVAIPAVWSYMTPPELRGHVL